MYYVSPSVLTAVMHSSYGGMHPLSIYVLRPTLHTEVIHVYPTLLLPYYCTTVYEGYSVGGMDVQHLGHTAYTGNGSTTYYHLH